MVTAGYYHTCTGTTQPLIFMAAIQNHRAFQVLLSTVCAPPLEARNPGLLTDTSHKPSQKQVPQQSGKLDTLN